MKQGSTKHAYHEAAGGTYAFSSLSSASLWRREFPISSAPPKATNVNRDMIEKNEMSEKLTVENHGTVRDRK